MNFCNNEEWFAAYLDKRLSEEDRRRYETHLSSCTRCLADLVAAKAELDEMAAEETEKAPARSRRSVPRLVSLSMAAVIICVIALSILVHFEARDRGLRAAQSNIARILATAEIGSMRLSNGPDRPVAHTAVYRGADERGSDLIRRTEKDLKEALEKHERDWRIYAMLGDVYVAANQIPRAENYYAQALGLNPGNIRLLNALALAAYRRDDFDLSRRYLESALAADGTRLETIYNLAVLYRDTGDRERSNRYFESYLEKDPSSPWAERAKALARD